MDLRQWQAVTAHLAERRRQHRDRIVGDDAGRFHYDRARLIDSVGREAQRVVDSYDRRREAQELADGARNAVAAAAAISAGARRLRRARRGDCHARPRPTSTGLIMASLRRRRSDSSSSRRSAAGRRRICGAKIAAVRERLSSSLREQFGRGDR